MLGKGIQGVRQIALDEVWSAMRFGRRSRPAVAGYSGTRSRRSSASRRP
jgi:hypothetical protein